MQAARIFISYRTSDGADKATRLARDLGAAFGDAQVFLDKEDLPAGLPWRDAIGAALGTRPVLLVLVTPGTFEARDAAGLRRIDQPDDPVRREICSALEFNAQVIPLLADGVARLPADLPPPLDGLGERTWRPLRAYDWRHDFERIVADLQALGVPSTRPWLDRRIAIAAGAVLAVAGASGAGWWFGPRARRLATDVSGDWTARVAPPANDAGSRLDRVLLQLTQQGEDVSLVSRPIDITQDPAWSGFRDNWLRLNEQRLDRVVWRGRGSVRRETGQPARLDIALSVETEAGGKTLEGGKLNGETDASGTRLTGHLWFNGEQAERTLELRRGH